MRVALVCGRYLPDRDGVADYVRQLAQALPDAGATPVIVTWSTVGAWRGAGASVDALPIDLVHVQWSPSAYGFRPGDRPAAGLAARAAGDHDP